jgi:hypothetical protein
VKNVTDQLPSNGDAARVAVDAAIATATKETTENSAQAKRLVIGGSRP